jgi:hypothetical protein
MCSSASVAYPKSRSTHCIAGSDGAEGASGRVDPRFASRRRRADLRPNERAPRPNRSASLKQRSLVKPRAHSAGLLCHWRRVRVHASLDTRTDEANGLTSSKSTRHNSGMNHRHVAFARWTLWRTFCCPARFQLVIRGVREMMAKGFVDACHPEKVVSTHRCAPAWSAWSGMVDDGVGR